MPRKRCNSWPFCDRFVSADAPSDERWCDEHRAIFDRVYNSLHPRKKRGEKAGWKSSTLLPSSTPQPAPPKASRGTVGPAYRQAILNALAKGAMSGTDLAAAVQVEKANSTYLRARAALVKDGQIARKGNTWSIVADEQSAAA
jgi:hypothetical protein